MSNNMKKYSIWFVVLAVLSIAVLSGVLIFLHFNSGRISLADAVVDAIVGCFILFLIIKTIDYCTKTEKISDELISTSEKIRSGKIHLDDENHIGVNFNNDILKTRFEKFCHDVERTKTGSVHGFADIDNYINYDVIDIIMKKDVVSLFPGIMTSLGIIGTFVGLFFGMQSMNAEAFSNFDSLRNAATTLMNGLSTAFITSIFGLGCSIIYSCILKSSFSGFYLAVDSFIDAYTDFEKDKIESNAYKILIDNQNRQFEAYKSYVTDMHDALDSVMSPYFEKMNNTVESFANAASKVQTDGVSRIVDNFISVSHKVLKEELSDLKTVLSDTCDKQKGYISEINTSTARTIELSASLDKKIDIVYEALQKIQDGAADLQQLQDNINESVGRYSEKVIENCESLTEYKNSVKNIQDAQLAIADGLKKFESDTLDKIGEFKTILGEGYREISVNTAGEIGALINQTTKDVTEKLQKQQETLDVTLKTITDTNTEIGTALGTFEAKTSEYLDNFNETLSIKCDKIANSVATELYDASVSSSDKISSELDSSVEKLGALGNAFESKAGELIGMIEQKTAELNASISEQATAREKDLLEYRNSVGNNIGDSAERLESAIDKIVKSTQEEFNNGTQGFAEKLGSSLTALAVAAEKLKDTSDNIPDALDNVVGNLSKALEDMSNTLNSLLYSVQAMNVKIEKTREAENNEQVNA